MLKFSGFDEEDGRTGFVVGYSNTKNIRVPLENIQLVGQSVTMNEGTAVLGYTGNPLIASVKDEDIGEVVQVGNIASPAVVISKADPTLQVDGVETTLVHTGNLDALLAASGVILEMQERIAELEDALTASMTDVEEE